MTTPLNPAGVGHTPGPWTAIKAGSIGFDIFDPRGRDVVTVYGGGVEIEHKAANARLIAAAPDLLAALIAAESLFAHTFAQDRTIHKQMRAAISRATGDA